MVQSRYPVGCVWKSVGWAMVFVVDALHGVPQKLVSLRREREGMKKMHADIYRARLYGGTERRGGACVSTTVLVWI